MSGSTLLYSSSTMGATVADVRIIPGCDGSCVFDTTKDGSCVKCGHVRFALKVGGYSVCSGCDNATHKCACCTIEVVKWETHVAGVTSDVGDLCDMCGKQVNKGDIVVVSPYERTYYDTYYTHVKCHFTV